MSHHRCRLRRPPHGRWRDRRGRHLRDQEGVAAGAGKRTTPPGAASVPQTKPRIRCPEPLVSLTRVERDELGGATVAQATALPPFAPFTPIERPA